MAEAEFITEDDIELILIEVLKTLWTGDKSKAFALVSDLLINLTELRKTDKKNRYQASLYALEKFKNR